MEENERSRMATITSSNVEELLLTSPVPRVSQDFEAENDYGSVEYKYKLVAVSEDRLQHLVTQLNFRLNEGEGECMYRLGVEDDGTARGLCMAEIVITVKTIVKMASILGEVEPRLRSVLTGHEGLCVELDVRRTAAAEGFVELRACVVGNVDAGKTTLVGVLTHKMLDNGRGRARMSVFRHPHEVQNGRTSSISYQIMGFDHQGQSVNDRLFHKGAWREIVKESAKVITFADLAGHERYLKTTAFGLSSHRADYAILVVAANKGVLPMTREHLRICKSLGVPSFVVVTKTDICPEHVLQDTLNQLSRLIQRVYGRTRCMVSSAEHVSAAVEHFASGQSVPVFLTSCVSGKGLSLLRQFLSRLPQHVTWSVDDPLEFDIVDKFHVKGVGTVVGGTVSSGSIRLGDSLLLGPDTRGNFMPVTVRSIHHQKVPVKRISAGSSAALGLKRVKRCAIRKGMVIVNKRSRAEPSFAFEACIQFHTPTLLRPRYQPQLLIGNVKQVAQVTILYPPASTSTAPVLSPSPSHSHAPSAQQDGSYQLEAGQQVVVRFQFLYRPEYLSVGDRILICDRTARGSGVITRTAVDDAPSIPNLNLTLEPTLLSLSISAVSSGSACVDDDVMSTLSESTECSIEIDLEGVLPPNYISM